MNAQLLEHLKRLGEEGLRRFSGWDSARFRAFGRDVLEPAWERVGTRNPQAFEALACLVQHGVGEGYLGGDPADEPRNLLEFCVRDWLPERLAETPPAEQVPLVARVWNLAEGLLREPEWVNDYVMSRVEELRGGARVEAFLVEALRPLLEPVEPARWEEPYAVNLLSLRAADDEFLPGVLRLAAPTILVVKDRRRPVRLGVHLRRGGRSRVLGRFGATGSCFDEPSGPLMAWEGGTLRIGAVAVALPMLASPRDWVPVGAGFVVATAADSQKLWIVEAAA